MGWGKVLVVSTVVIAVLVLIVLLIVHGLYDLRFISEVVADASAPETVIDWQLDGNTIHHAQFAKRDSIPLLVLYMLGLPRGAGGLEEENSLFTTDLKDRGPGNRMKKRYMSALQPRHIATDMVRTRAMLKRCFRGRTMHALFEEFVPYYLQLHLGDDVEVPAHTVDFFQRFLRAIGLVSISLPMGFWDFWTLGDLRVRARRVLKFLKNQVRTIEPGDSCFVSRWKQGGLEEERITFAVLHNIVAFSQLLRVCHILLVDRATTDKYVPAFRSSGWAMLPTIFREHVPNGASLSRDVTTSMRTRHVHRKIMAPLEPGTTLELADPGKCPFLLHGDGQSHMRVSDVDNETLFFEGFPVPVFDKASYTPFGLGYRRCAGESFTYAFSAEVLACLSEEHVAIRPGDDSRKIPVGPRKSVLDNLVLTPITR